MLAATRQGRRIIAPYQALWIPAGIEHSITFLSATKMRSLYFDKSEHKDIFESKSIKVFAATALIRELIAALFQHQFPGAKQEMRCLLLLLVQETKAFNTDVLMPEEEPLRSALNDLLHHRAWSTSAQELANKLNVTPRTFTRHFIRATGMSFRDWKHRMRLIFALEKIANGFPVKSAAILAGYGDASAFQFSSRTFTDLVQAIFSNPTTNLQSPRLNKNVLKKSLAHFLHLCKRNPNVHSDSAWNIESLPVSPNNTGFNPS